VVVATLSAATAYLISVLIRPLVLVARMRVHVRMDPESAYHGLLGHEGRYVLLRPASRVEDPLARYSVGSKLPLPDPLRGMCGPLWTHRTSSLDNVS
jgi:hypothetical protein